MTSAEPKKSILVASLMCGLASILLAGCFNSYTAEEQAQRDTRDAVREETIEVMERVEWPAGYIILETLDNAPVLQIEVGALETGGLSGSYGYGLQVPAGTTGFDWMPHIEDALVATGDFEPRNVAAYEPPPCGDPDVIRHFLHLPSGNQLSVRARGASTEYDVSVQMSYSADRVPTGESLVPVNSSGGTCG